MTPKISSFKIFFFAAIVILASSCSTITTALKSPDRDYKFEMARQMYAKGDYSNASMLLENVLPALKGTQSGDEGLFMLGMCKYKKKDFIGASEIFKRYYTQSYPMGDFVDEARFHAAMSYFNSTLPTRLDQTNTYTAIDELNKVLEFNPNTKHRAEIKELLFKLQDQLVEKEYLSAKLYYDLGEYFGNCTSGGNNYQACVITSQNAVKNYPFSPRKEEFAYLILKAKFELAEQSVDAMKFERFNDTIDEYYGFVNEFPKSKYIAEAKRIFEKADKMLKSNKVVKYKTVEA